MMYLKSGLFFSLILILAFSLAACSPADDTPGPGEEEILPDTAPGDPRPSPMAAGDQLLNLGEGVYMEQCAFCHQVDGTGMGNVYPALDGNPVVTGDPQPVIDIVLRGRGAMPAFAGILTDEELAAVVSFIRRAWTNQADFVTIEQVEAAR
jgi:mono/diheme cytochrome c family protein